MSHPLGPSSLSHPTRFYISGKERAPAAMPLDEGGVLNSDRAFEVLGEQLKRGE